MIRHSLIFTAPREVEVVEEHLPPPAEGEVLVESHISAISPGTERLIFEGQAPSNLAADEELPGFEGDLSFPLRYGYAVVGQVRALGPNVPDSWLHQSVFAFHPHSSAFTMQTSDLIKLPESLSSEDAVFLPNLETAVNFLHDGRPLIGERVLVIGQGIVGLLTTSLLKNAGPAQLFTVEPVESRRRYSLEAGAQRCYDPTEPGDLTALERQLELGHKAGGGDLIYELSGDPQALNLAIRMAGFGARIIIGSWYGTKTADELDLGAAFHRNRLTLKSSQVSTIDPPLSARWSKSRRIQLVLDLLEKLQPSRWVTDRFDLQAAQQAYERLANPDAFQILLNYKQEH